MPAIPSNPLTSTETALKWRITRLSELLGKILEVPEAWATEPLEDDSGGSRKKSRKEATLDPIPCDNYRDLIKSWRKAMKWTDGLDTALSVMLASISSTMSVGDQLWVKIIGPASCGKSTLCEAVSVARKYVLAKSTLRGFHTGMIDESGEDYSLISKLAGKTFVTKDGDTLLQAPNLGQILSEARDIYDTVSRTSYRNKASRDYSGIRMTWILCGTSSLRSIDSSELGERFLDCVIMNGIDDDLEDEILLRVANRAERNLSIEADGDATTHQDPALTEAMQLTGGYVEYLRENATALLSQVETPEWALRKATRLGKFVAYMRARPSLRQTENAEREFAARLVSQHVRLMKCLAVVLNRPTVDEETVARTRKVCLDTARGVTLQIADVLYESEEGLPVDAIIHRVNRKPEEVRNLLRFLKEIGALETYVMKTKGVTSKARWVLTPRLRNLYTDVVVD